MIKGENIVCISNTIWYGNYAKSTVQILSRLARNNNVLFVEYPHTAKDLLAAISGKHDAPIMQMLRFKKGLSKIETDVQTTVNNLVMPAGIPVYFFKNEKFFNFFFKINVFIYKTVLKRTLKKINFDNPLVITAYNPFYGLSVLGKLNEKAHIYYCYDGVETGFFGKRIYDFENQFSMKADAIITTSDFLNDDKLKINPNSFVVKNGVDFPVFEKFAKTKIYERKRKKVGFIGSLDPRFDIETVEYIVKEMPDFDFEFTGDMRNQLLKSRLSKFSNVKFFNPIKPNDVPALLATYDVGIIPYIVNEVNRNIYPLKINEFLAVGVPVVMTPFALLSDFEGIVSVSDSQIDFVNKLRQETEFDTNEKIKTRIQFASTNSWDERTESFSKILEKFI